MTRPRDGAIFEVRLRRAIVLVDDIVHSGERLAPRELLPAAGRSFKAASRVDALRRLDGYLGSFGFPPLVAGDSGVAWQPATGEDAGRFDHAFRGDGEAIARRNGRYRFVVSVWVDLIVAQPLRFSGVNRRERCDAP